MIEALLQAERLLAHGMVDQAEQIYRQAIEQDPRNAIAVVGLARVALEQGDDGLALERARTALEIDPQNAAALRLAERLAEVFAARQQPDNSSTLDDGQRRTDEARPSERAFFTRNPSMADHQQMQEQRSNEQVTDAEKRPDIPTQPRPGLVRRILGR